MKSLPNISNLYSINDININLSEQIIGNKINITKETNSLSLNDEMFLKFIKMNCIDFTTTYSLSKKILDTLNHKHKTGYVDLIPENIYKKNKNLFFNLLRNISISEYYLNVLPRRYELTGMIQDALYDHTTAITGRMKVIKGKNFLTMKKEERKKIPVQKGNRLVEIDIKSCEPALLHAVLYGETPNDIYSLFDFDISRGKIKLAVISSIYGSNVSKVCKLSGLSKQQVLNIHDHFQLQKIKKEIEDEFKQKDCFYNLYGRPIYSVHSPVNYWLQSSAADFACLAFLDLIKRAGLKLKACIHDAIIVELSNDQHNAVSKVSKIKDPISNIILNVEHSILI